MTHIKDAKPEPLAAGTPTPDDALREARADAKHWQAQFEAAHWERAEIRQALDAARAETEAVREERDAARHELSVAHAELAQAEAGLEVVAALRAETEAVWADLNEARCVVVKYARLAAELVEGLLGVIAVADRKTDEFDRAKEAIARARALGIGGEGGDD